MKLLLIHLLLTSFMTGLIWLVQIVHYPLFTFVDKSSYRDFQKAHMLRVGLLVIPIMGIELITGFLLLHKFNNYPLLLWNTGMLCLIWLVTFGVFTFIHATLREGFDGTLIRKLILFNWIRTFLLSLRTALLFITIVQA